MHPLSSKAQSLDAYLQGKWVCFDFETTNKDYGDALNPDNRVVMVAWQSGVGTSGPTTDVQYYYGNPLECKEFWQALAESEYLIAHNGKFEAHWLWRLGFDPTAKLWYDTMLGEWVRYGNVRMPLDLGATSVRYGFEDKDREVAVLIAGGVCPSEIPEHLIVKRCVTDVRTTTQIQQQQMKLLHQREQLACQLMRCLTMPVLCAIERSGIKLDKERVTQTYSQYRGECTLLDIELAAITGGINMDSPAQKAKFFYGTLGLPERRGPNGKPLRNKPSKQFPDGQPLTDAETVQWLKEQARTPEQKVFFEKMEQRNSVHAALSKNLEFFKGIVDEQHGVFYAEVRQTTTGTHRLSGRGKPQTFTQFEGAKSVQPHNMPRDFKKLQRSRDPDYVVVQADAPQLEFRVACQLGGPDEAALANIRDPDFDAHIMTASVIHDYDYKTLLDAYRGLEYLAAPNKAEAKKMRQDAKPDTYKPLYGGEKGTRAQERYYKWFQQTYHQFYNKAMGWLQDVERVGWIRTLTGLRFRWTVYYRNGIAFDKRTHKPVKPSVFNYPVQYLATGEIVPMALVWLYHTVKRAKLRVKFTNTVHDSIDAEVHKDDVTEYRKLLREAFTTRVYKMLRTLYGIEWKVPLGVDITWGEFLGEGETEQFNLEPSEAV